MIHHYSKESSMPRRESWVDCGGDTGNLYSSASCFVEMENIFEFPWKEHRADDEKQDA
jgi:hypothetical protein